MPLDAATAKALRARGVAFAEDVPLAKKAYWRAGGPADALVEVPDLGTLRAVQEAVAEGGAPLFVLGNGSNVLIADGGVRGLVVQLTERLADAAIAEGTAPPEIVVGAGLKNVALLARAQRQGWTGLEWLAGIPGTVGGAVRMNAGSSLGEAVDALLEVEVVLRGGEVRVLPMEALSMRYRSSDLPEGSVVARARFRTTAADADESRERVRAFLDRRKATQPLDKPSCGSTFRNPPGDHAGRLIEAAGLKGFGCGGAQVSEKHANFVVNLGEATAADIRRVVEHVERAVHERFGVRLEREVHFVGDWEGWAAP